MQDGVLGEVHQNGEAVTLAAAEHDEIDLPLTGHPDDLRFDISGLDAVKGVRETELRRQRSETLARAHEQLYPRCGPPA